MIQVYKITGYSPNPRSHPILERSYLFETPIEDTTFPRTPMPNYRNLDPEMIARVCAEVDREIEERNAQREADERLAAQIRFIQDPKNKALIDSDPMVQ